MTKRWRRAGLLLAAMLAVYSALAVTWADKPAPGDVKVFAPSAQDKKAITEYLAKNIGDPDYEVVEWAKLQPDKTGAYHVFVRVRQKTPLGGYAIEIINTLIRKGKLVSAARDWKVFPNSPEWRAQKSTIDGLREMMNYTPGKRR